MLADTSILELIKEIVRNTEPLDLFKHNLSWWSFGIALLGVLISSFAAFFSFLGFKYQKKSADHLAKMLPSHISMFSFIKTLINNFFDFRAINYDVHDLSLPYIKVILDSSKIHHDLIDVKRYENSNTSYNSAITLIRNLRTYNTYIDHLINLYSTSKESPDIDKMTNEIINLAFDAIFYITSFEKLLCKEGILDDIESTTDVVVGQLLDSFFDILEDYLIHDDLSQFIVYDIDDEFKYHLLYNVFIPKTMDFQKYIDNDNSNISINKIPRKDYIRKLSNGEYDSVIHDIFQNKELPKLSSIIFEDFIDAYGSFIDPLLLAESRSSHFIRNIT